MPSWTRRSIEILAAEAARSADTHLIRLDLPAFPGIPLYLKDESAHPTGSLKHRLARSLFLYAICNGWLHEDQPVIEASSGSTAISEAYFARLLGLPFIAAMPRRTSCDKIAQIEHFGGGVIGRIIVHDDDFMTDARQGIADLGDNAANGRAFIQGADDQAEIGLARKGRSTLDIRQKRNSPAPARQGFPPSIKNAWSS